MRFSKLKIFVALIVCLVAASTLALILKEAQAVTGVPEVISYQGRLTNSSGTLLSGTYVFRFSIWDGYDVGFGNQLWPSGTPGNATTTLVDGVFNIDIGKTASGTDALTYNFNDNDTVYLQVEVSSDGTSFETLAPRQQITASGFAINANTANTANVSLSPGAWETKFSNALTPTSTLAGIFVNASSTFDSTLRVNNTLSLNQNSISGKGLVINAIGSASANLIELNNSSGTFLSGFTASGGLLINIASTTAFVVQDGSGNNHFVVNTSSATASSTFRGGAVFDTNTLVINASENRIGI